MSVTGANADKEFQLKAVVKENIFCAYMIFVMLMNQPGVSKKTNHDTLINSNCKRIISLINVNLLVVSGSDNERLQIVINEINELYETIGETH